MQKRPEKFSGRFCLGAWGLVNQRIVPLCSRWYSPVSAEVCYVPGGLSPSGTFFSVGYLPKKNETAMYQQASPFGDKRQFVGIAPSP